MRKLMQSEWWAWCYGSLIGISAGFSSGQNCEGDKIWSLMKATLKCLTAIKNVDMVCIFKTDLVTV